MTHPSEENLALFAGGDLGLLDRFRVSRHLGCCAACRAEVARFEASASALAGGAECLPEGLHWERLASEMTANIRLGLEAGECVAPPPVRQPNLGWRPALALGSATAVVMAAWWINIPYAQQRAQQARQAQVETVVVQPAAEGIEVKSKQGALTLLRPRESSTALYVSTPGSLRERFVDGETGQVTINNVYSE